MVFDLNSSQYVLEVLKTQPADTTQQSERKNFRRKSEQKHHATLEGIYPDEYSIATVANREIPAKQLVLVDISITDGEGLSAPDDALFKLAGGIIAPGVILLEGLTSPSKSVAIMNSNNESRLL